ncbi:MAG: threonine synthase [Fusobacteriota bacterium]
MKYISTRGNIDPIEGSEAIVLGMVPDGGLFIPESIPKVSRKELNQMKNFSYQDLTKKIFAKFLTNFSSGEIEKAVHGAYNTQNFDDKDLTPLKKINDDLYIMELWHGPTAAFKDMALQIMPYLLNISKQKNSNSTKTLILVATSGDTGKAALEGFKNLEGIEIIVFYPEGGVSKVQNLQMNTTTGDNTSVMSVVGNFDDCQTSVKNIFQDKEFNKKISKYGYNLSSANSINWGRLLPQIIYYFKGYYDLVQKNAIEYGDKINFSVPTGNFGDILGGYYAKKMGLPINKLVCASNKNKILTDFLKTGIYDTQRTFHKTMSPSMDILVSSNLERFLFEISEHNSDMIKRLYSDLKNTGKFEVSQDILERIHKVMVGGFTDEKATLDTIKSEYNKSAYLLDTHTAVAVNVAKKLKSYLGNITIVNSTANPYKFSKNVLKALGKKEEDGIVAVKKLNEITKMDIHRAVKGIETKKILHEKTIKPTEIKKSIIDILE